MTTIQGKIINDIEPSSTFKGLCDGPKQLLQFILANTIFETDIENKIIIKDNLPVGEEKRSLWVKTSWPYAVGMLIDGEYQMDYGMCGFPVNTPFLHSKISLFKDGVRQLGDGDCSDFGINNTITTASKRMFWYIFEPPSLT